MTKEFRKKLGIKKLKMGGFDYAGIGDIIRASKKVKSAKKIKSAKKLAFSAIGATSTTANYKPRINIFRKLINKIYEIIRHF